MRREDVPVALLLCGGYGPKTAPVTTDPGGPGPKTATEIASIPDGTATSVAASWLPSRPPLDMRLMGRSAIDWYTIVVFCS